VYTNVAYDTCSAFEKAEMKNASHTAIEFAACTPTGAHGSRAASGADYREERDADVRWASVGAGWVPTWRERKY